MLDIISMITFLLLFVVLPILLIIVSANNKTEEEQCREDEQQMQYLKEYREKKIKLESNMKSELYNWSQVEAYSIVALHNLLNSANDIKIKNMKMFIDPLQTLYSKDEIEKHAKKLIDTDK